MILVQDVLQAFVISANQEMIHLLKRAESMQVDTEDVAITGGRVVLDVPEIWVKLPELGRVRRAELSNSWKQLSSGHGAVVA